MTSTDPLRSFNAAEQAELAAILTPGEHAELDQILARTRPATTTSTPSSTTAAIDRALHYDTTRDGGPGWQPGQPLHDQHQATWWAAEDGLHDPSTTLRNYHRIRADARWCTPCDVGWILTPAEADAIAGTGVEKGCWSCGQAPDPDTTRPVRWSSSAEDFVALEAPTIEAGDTVRVVGRNATWTFRLHPDQGSRA